MRLHPARAVGLLRAPWIPGWSKDPLWRRARAVPSLDLRFADNKSLVDATTGQSLVTFTRSSEGTFVNSQGLIETAANNVPRFDHNPTTGESLGLLVEEQRQNLLLRSEDFSTGWTTSQATLTANAGVAPNGTNTAGKLILNNGSTVASSRAFYQNTTGFTGVGVVSIYAKAAEFSLLRISFQKADGTLVVGTDYNLSNGSTGALTGASSVQIIPAGGGWYRCVAVFDFGTGASAVRAYFASTEATGDGVSGILTWGAQLEAGAFPTSYIRSEASAATRAADVASISGSILSSGGGNTLFAQFRSPASGTRPIVSLDDNSANERIELLTSGTDPKLLVTDGGVAQADIDAGTITANTSTRLAAHFAANDFAASVGGNTSVIDTSGTMPTVDRVRIGANQAGGYLNGHIARVTNWPTALPMLPPVSS